MKKICIITEFIILCCLSSCSKKYDFSTMPLASLTVVNAVNGGTTARLGNYRTNIPNKAYAQLALVTGENNLYVWPVGDSLKPYFTQLKFNAEAGEAYSLFLTGTPIAPEGILIKETIPYHTDSTGGIRFINLAPNSGPLNITLSTSTNRNEVTGLAYKNVTEFKTYPTLTTSAYTFQVRAAADTTIVLTTFSLDPTTVPRFANITLVIRQNGTGLGTFQVNNDR